MTHLFGFHHHKFTQALLFSSTLRSGRAYVLPLFLREQLHLSRCKRWWLTAVMGCGHTHTLYESSSVYIVMCSQSRLLHTRMLPSNYFQLHFYTGHYITAPLIRWKLTLQLYKHESRLDIPMHHIHVTSSLQFNKYLAESSHKVVQSVVNIVI